MLSQTTALSDIAFLWSDISRYNNKLESAIEIYQKMMRLSTLDKCYAKLECDKTNHKFGKNPSHNRVFYGLIVADNT
jgi:hypothetical protein